MKPKKDRQGTQKKSEVKTNKRIPSPKPEIENEEKLEINREKEPEVDNNQTLEITPSNPGYSSQINESQDRSVDSFNRPVIVDRNPSCN